MKGKHFERLVEQALIHFPNMPKHYIENAISRAASRFFRDTGLLKDDVYFDADCNQSDFILDIPDGRTIVQAKRLYGNGAADRYALLDSSWIEIAPARDRFGNGYWVDLQGALPTIYIPHTCRLNSGRYALTYTWTPDNQDCELPQHFVGKYFDAIEHGALANLYLIPMDTDTQNTTMAKYHLDSFYRAIANADVEAEQNHTDRPLFMQGRSFI